MDSACPLSNPFQSECLNKIFLNQIKAKSIIDAIDKKQSESLYACENMLCNKTKFVEESFELF